MPPLLVTVALALPPLVCPHCGGRGVVDYCCTRCDGRVHEDTCHRCEGSGVLVEDERRADGA